jgi:Leucine-rich repeat (LRR) protein
MLAIAKSLRRLPNVHTLDISDNRLTDVSLQEVMR